MRHALALFLFISLGAHAANAADVFVRQARGANLEAGQVRQITSHVKSAVRSMPEHKLVTVESQADFVLEPTLVTRGDQMVLRIEKTRDGQTLAMAEEPIQSMDAVNTNALAATESAMQQDLYATADRSESSGTESGTTAGSAAGTGVGSGVGIEERPSDRLSIAGNRNISSSPTQDVSPSQSPPSGISEGTVSGATQSVGTTDSGDSIAARDSGPAASEVRAPAPRFADPNRIGYVQAGVGPAFPLGLDSDQLMYNLNAGYNIDFSPSLTGKAFGDLNLSTGGDTSRFINLGLGLEVFPTTETLAGGRPYLMGDVGYAFTRRNNTDEQRDGVAVGAGAGFKFSAQQLNMDVNLHYTVLTEEVQGDNPSVLGLRFALNF